jgi:hypothetical protein
MVEYFQEEMAKERGKLRQVGVKFITFPEEEAKTYLDKAYDAYWKNLEEKVPDLVPKLKEITGN